MRAGGAVSQTSLHVPHATSGAMEPTLHASRRGLEPQDRWFPEVTRGLQAWFSAISTVGLGKGGRRAETSRERLGVSLGSAPQLQSLLGLGWYPRPNSTQYPSTGTKLKIISFSGSLKSWA